MRTKKQQTKLLVPFSVSRSHNIYLSIPTDQLVSFLLIAMEIVTLEDLVGSNFTLFSVTSPPTIPY